MKYSVITISREFGSGGHDIGAAVAARLGIDFYDNEFIRYAAERSGIGTDYIRESGEHASRGQILASALQNAYPSGNAVPLSTQDKLHFIQSELTREFAAKGPCVIVGRSAEYVLRDRSDVLNVFVRASTEYRIAQIEQRLGLDEKAARKEIARKDKQRATYCSYYTGRVWGDIGNYHICLDSGALGCDVCAELLCSVFENRR